MALYHFHVTQIKRSAGQSAIACAAYRSGENLYSEYYRENSDYTRKSGVVCSEILLPPNAPAEYADRQTLWNAVEKREVHPKAQLAYSFDIALQTEFSLEENIALARQFLLDEFVSQGMIVDFAVHDPDRESGIPNTHFHFMVPMRPLDENGKFGEKQHRVYALDEAGERLRDEKGQYIFNAVPTTDWGSPERLDSWRAAWAKVCNDKFEEKNLPERIDHRTLKAQGIDRLPTVHEGPAVRQMEARGIATYKGSLNRTIRRFNEAIAHAVAEVKLRLEKLKDLEVLLSQTPEIKEPSISNLLSRYYDARNDGAYSQTAKNQNLKRFSQDVLFLQTHDIHTLEDMRIYLLGKQKALDAMERKYQPARDRIRELSQTIRLLDDFKRLKPIADAIPEKGLLGIKQKQYQEEHASELNQFYAVARKIKAGNLKLNQRREFQSELENLKSQLAESEESRKAMQAEIKELKGLQYRLEFGIEPKKKESVLQKLHMDNGQNRPIQTSTKKPDMER